MPSYNFTKTVHNKWLRQSWNWNTNLYIATIDDFVQAFIQGVRYHLKGVYVSTSPRKEELLLRAAQRSTERSRDLKVLNNAMGKLPRVDLFYTREPHLVG